MRVAAADPDLSPAAGERRSVRVGALEHVAVVSLDGREIFLKPDEISELAAAGDARKDVIDTEENPALTQVHEQGDKVAAALLELDVLALMDVVNADVDLRTAGHPARQLFAEEEAGVAAQFFGAFDPVVVGQGEQTHSPPVQAGVNFLGVAIAFAAEFGDEGSGAGPRVIRVHVHIAFHDFHNKSTTLPTDDIRAKILKIKIVN